MVCHARRARQRANRTQDPRNGPDVQPHDTGLLPDTPQSWRLGAAALTNRFPINRKPATEFLRSNQNDPSRPQLSPRVAEFAQEIQAHRARLIFALDATASRERTWDLACQLQSEMFADGRQNRRARSSTRLVTAGYKELQILCLDTRRR